MLARCRDAHLDYNSISSSNNHRSLAIQGVPPYKKKQDPGGLQPPGTPAVLRKNHQKWWEMIKNDPKIIKNDSKIIKLDGFMGGVPPHKINDFRGDHDFPMEVPPR